MIWLTRILIAALLSVVAVGAADAQNKAKVLQTATAAPTKDPLALLRNFALNDIQAALDDAKANNDTAAVDCWSAMLPAIQNAQSPVPTKLGAFLALQKARDAVRGVDMFKAGVGPLADLKNKCAAIIVDTNTFLLRLGVLSGGAAFGF